MSAPNWEQVRDLRREVTRLDRIQRDELGWLLPAIRENTIDLLGPEPADDDSAEAVEWNATLLASFVSEIDAEGGCHR